MQRPRIDRSLRDTYLQELRDDIARVLPDDNLGSNTNAATPEQYMEMATRAVTSDRLRDPTTAASLLTAADRVGWPHGIFLKEAMETVAWSVYAASDVTHRDDLARGCVRMANVQSIGGLIDKLARIAPSITVFADPHIRSASASLHVLDLEEPDRITAWRAASHADQAAWRTAWKQAGQAIPSCCDDQTHPPEIIIRRSSMSDGVAWLKEAHVVDDSVTRQVLAKHLSLHPTTGEVASSDEQILAMAKRMSWTPDDVVQIPIANRDADAAWLTHVHAALTAWCPAWNADTARRMAVDPKTPSGRDMIAAMAVLADPTAPVDLGLSLALGNADDQVLSSVMTALGKHAAPIAMTMLSHAAYAQDGGDGIRMGCAVVDDADVRTRILDQIAHLASCVSSTRGRPNATETMGIMLEHASLADQERIDHIAASHLRTHPLEIADVGPLLHLPKTQDIAHALLVNPDGQWAASSRGYGTDVDLVAIIRSASQATDARWDHQLQRQWQDAAADNSTYGITRKHAILSAMCRNDVAVHNNLPTLIAASRQKETRSGCIPGILRIPLDQHVASRLQSSLLADIGKGAFSGNTIALLADAMEDRQVHPSNYGLASAMAMHILMATDQQKEPSLCQSATRIMSLCATDAPA